MPYLLVDRTRRLKIACGPQDWLSGEVEIVFATRFGLSRASKRGIMPQRNQLASGPGRARSKPISLRITVYPLRDAYKEARKAKAAKLV